MLLCWHRADAQREESSGTSSCGGVAVGYGGGLAAAVFAAGAAAVSISFSKRARLCRVTWQDERLPGTNSMLPKHCYDDPLRSRMRELHLKELRIADAYSCQATTAPSTTRSRNAGLSVLAAGTFDKGDSILSCSELNVYHDLSSRQST